ncbi:Response regulator receiver domain-containing protein [Rhizobium sp. NFR07]|nr:Response regulator receiver domain-containing protein [Rhizobium sp. NFR07]
MSDKLILLLEDQPLISLDVEESLSENGFRNIVTLRSQKEASAWLGEFAPDFVLLDLYLDDGDSRPVLEHLKQAGTPFLIYTGSEKPPEWDDGLFAASEWVSKPVDPAILASLIKKKLGLA